MFLFGYYCVTGGKIRWMKVAPPHVGKSKGEQQTHDLRGQAGVVDFA